MEEPHLEEVVTMEALGAMEEATEATEAAGAREGPVAMEDLDQEAVEGVTARHQGLLEDQTGQARKEVVITTMMTMMMISVKQLFTISAPMRSWPPSREGKA